jgi:cytochrome oxidase Cu insertion factor (SCO1/SenC/PrrC family)
LPAIRAAFPRLARSDRRRLGLLVLAGVGAGITIGAAVGLLSRSSGHPHATIVSSRYGMDGMASWAIGARVAPAIDTLTDQAGRPFALGSLHGHAVALVFFDSHCTSECPLEGRELAAAESTLPRAQRPVVVAVSVNPADTRASVARAMRKWGLAGVAPWYWLMGTRRTLAPVWSAYHIQVGPKVHGDIAHTEALYLIDRHGYERSGYLYPFGQQFVIHDLRVLARDRKA